LRLEVACLINSLEVPFSPLHRDEQPENIVLTNQPNRLLEPVCNTTLFTLLDRYHFLSVHLMLILVADNYTKHLEVRFEELEVWVDEVSELENK